MATKQTTDADQPEGMSILQALQQLKDEIVKAQDEAIAKKQAPMFSIDEGELELKLVAKRERKGEGSGKLSFKLYVLDAELAAGASRTGTIEATQTLTIKFKALRPGAPAALEDGVKFGARTQTIPGSLNPLSPVIQTDMSLTGGTKDHNTG